LPVRPPGGSGLSRCAAGPGRFPPTWGHRISASLEISLRGGLPSFHNFLGSPGLVRRVVILLSHSAEVPSRRPAAERSFSGFRNWRSLKHPFPRVLSVVFLPCPSFFWPDLSRSAKRFSSFSQCMTVPEYQQQAAPGGSFTPAGNEQMEAVLPYPPPPPPIGSSPPPRILSEKIALSSAFPPPVVFAALRRRVFFCWALASAFLVLSSFPDPSPPFPPCSLSLTSTDLPSYIDRRIRDSKKSKSPARRPRIPKNQLEEDRARSDPQSPDL